MKLYDWQKGCLRAWKENGFRGIAHVVTGGGKTAAALYAARLLENPVHFLCGYGSWSLPSPCPPPPMAPGHAAASSLLRLRRGISRAVGRREKGRPGTQVYGLKGEELLDLCEGNEAAEKRGR